MDKPLSTKPEECRYSFFQHTQCEFFPCHKTAKPEDFNCLFCYCPLYALGDKCGGNFTYVGDGIKDCSGCLVPHGRGSYSYITKKFPELAELARKRTLSKKASPDCTVRGCFYVSPPCFFSCLRHRPR